MDTNCLDVFDNYDASHHPPRPGKTPWLLYSKPDQIQYFCTTSPLPPYNESHLKTMFELEYTLVGSCHDWLILQHFYDFRLYNPITKQRIDYLPRLPDWVHLPHHDRVSSTLTCSPDCNCGVTCVLFVHCGTQVFLCRPTTEHPVWTCYHVHQLGLVNITSDPVALHGRIHVWAVNAQLACPCLVQLDVFYYESRIGITPISPSNVWNPWVDGSLIESQGRLYSVPDAYSRRFVQVWEFDFNRLCWVDVKSLDGRAFFIGPSCSTWCWGTTDDPTQGGVLENGLYFINDCKGVDDVYSCALHDGCVKFITPCQNPKYPFEALEGDSVVWFMPQHQRKFGEYELRQRQLLREQRQKFVRAVDTAGQFVNPTRPGKQLVQQQNQTPSSNLSDLPSEVIYTIAKRLPLFDYWSFRASCKMFRTAFRPLPEWRTPLFVYFKNNDLLYEVKDPSRTDSTCSATLVAYSPPYAVLASTRNGWLLVGNIDEMVIHYVNLFTNLRIVFPARSIAECFKVVGFSKHPTSPDSVTVGYCSTLSLGGHTRHNSIHYARQCSNDKEWGYFVLDMAFPDNPSSVIHHKRDFYFIDTNGNLGVFTLDRDRVNWRYYDRNFDIDNASFRPESSYLVECEGDLLSVFYGYHVIKHNQNELELESEFYDDEREEIFSGFKVFRRNNFEKWVEVESLGEYSLFLGPSSFSVAEREAEMQNRIYLPRMKDNGMVYYSMETGNFYAVGCEKPLENLSYTEIPLQCCWV